MLPSLFGDRELRSGDSHMGGPAGILHNFIIIYSRKIESQ